MPEICRFQTKPVVIQAYRVENEERIETLEGVMLASPGDWVVYGTCGEKFVVKNHDFRTTYAMKCSCGSYTARELPCETGSEAEECPRCGHVPACHEATVRRDHDGAGHG